MLIIKQNYVDKCFKLTYHCFNINLKVDVKMRVMAQNQGGERSMLEVSKRNSIGEAVDKLLKLDSIGMMIIMSNATALLARQELEESMAKQQTQAKEQSRQTRNRQ